jgi:hypothetical protein
MLITANNKMIKKEGIYMSQYDEWVKQEKAKIHKEYDQKREDLLGKSFEAGIDNPNQKSQRSQLSADYERLAQEEQTAIDTFMRTINTQQ